MKNKLDLEGYLFLGFLVIYYLGSLGLSLWVSRARKEEEKEIKRDSRNETPVPSKL